MSGHSKWAQIKRAKGVTDKKRAQTFTRIANGIVVAARAGRGLDLAIEKAKEANMPKENIDRAIARGKGEIPGVQIEEAIYEAYGPSGVAILIKTLSDNKNRAVASLRAVLNKYNGRLADSGSVAYLFEEKGVIAVEIAKQVLAKDDIEMIIIDSGAEDFKEDDGFIYVYIKPKQLGEVKKNLEFKTIKIDSANLEMSPKTYIDISEDKKESIIKLLEAIEEGEDVSEVFTNANL
jgi:YebC/PmpR family DNA-binding regulatory protein